MLSIALSTVLSVAFNCVTMRSANHTAIHTDRCTVGCAID